MTGTTVALPTLGLLFALGLRHGLDPDHVAVIDNVVFRAADERPRVAPWTGTLFALGHSLAVAGVALGVSAAAGRLRLPAWTAGAADVAVVLLLLLVGTLNLRALLRGNDYAPVGWRAGLVPARWRGSTHPAAVVGIGAVFGLVFDTATQAAAWGAAASTRGGVPAAAAIALAFATGMTIADTLDSQIVSRLLRTAGGAAGAVRRYRRAVGWLIVVLSYGMAALALLDTADVPVGLGEAGFTWLGVGAALLVIGLLARARLVQRAS